MISAGKDGVIHHVTSSDTSAAILSGSPAASINHGSQLTGRLMVDFGHSRLQNFVVPLTDLRARSCLPAAGRRRTEKCDTHWNA
jgi:hypothetical protein